MANKNIVQLLSSIIRKTNITNNTIGSLSSNVVLVDNKVNSVNTDLKTNYWSGTYVNDKINQTLSLQTQVYNSTGQITNPRSGILYLIKKTENSYTQYLYIDNSFISVGETDVSLDNYYNKDSIGYNDNIQFSKDNSLVDYINSNITGSVSAVSISLSGQDIASGAFYNGNLVLTRNNKTNLAGISGIQPYGSYLSSKNPQFTGIISGPSANIQNIITNGNQRLGDKEVKKLEYQDNTLTLTTVDNTEFSVEIETTGGKLENDKYMLAVNPTASGSTSFTFNNKTVFSDPNKDGKITIKATTFKNQLGQQIINYNDTELWTAVNKKVNIKNPVMSGTVTIEGKTLDTIIEETKSKYDVTTGYINNGNIEFLDKSNNTLFSVSGLPVLDDYVRKDNAYISNDLIVNGIISAGNYVFANYFTSELSTQGLAGDDILTGKFTSNASGIGTIQLHHKNTSLPHIFIENIKLDSREYLMADSPNGTGVFKMNNYEIITSDGRIKSQGIDVLSAIDNSSSYILNKLETEYLTSAVIQEKINKQAKTGFTYYSSFEQLPKVGDSRLIYIVPDSQHSATKYQYIFDTSSYVNIGTTDIDLTQYYTKSEVGGSYTSSFTVQKDISGKVSTASTYLNTQIDTVSSNIITGFTYSSDEGILIAHLGVPKDSSITKRELRVDGFQPKGNYLTVDKPNATEYIKVNNKLLISANNNSHILYYDDDKPLSETLSNLSTTLWNQDIASITFNEGQLKLTRNNGKSSLTAEINVQAKGDYLSSTSPSGSGILTIDAINANNIISAKNYYFADTKKNIDEYIDSEITAVKSTKLDKSSPTALVSFSVGNYQIADNEGKLYYQSNDIGTMISNISSTQNNYDISGGFMQGTTLKLRRNSGKSKEDIKITGIQPAGNYFNIDTKEIDSDLTIDGSLTVTSSLNVQGISVLDKLNIIQNKFNNYSTSKEVSTLIQSIQTRTKLVVCQSLQELQNLTEKSESIIYLVPIDGTTDRYDQYIYQKDAEQQLLRIGSTGATLSDYCTKEQFTDKCAELKLADISGAYFDKSTKQFVLQYNSDDKIKEISTVIDIEGGTGTSIVTGSYLSAYNPAGSGKFIFNGDIFLDDTTQYGNGTISANGFYSTKDQYYGLEIFDQLKQYSSFICGVIGTGYSIGNTVKNDITVSIANSQNKISAATSTEIKNVKDIIGGNYTSTNTVNAALESIKDTIINNITFDKTNGIINFYTNENGNSIAKYQVSNIQQTGKCLTIQEPSGHGNFWMNDYIVVRQTDNHILCGPSGNRTDLTQLVIDTQEALITNYWTRNDTLSAIDKAKLFEVEVTEDHTKITNPKTNVLYLQATTDNKYNQWYYIDNEFRELSGSGQGIAIHNYYTKSQSDANLHTASTVILQKAFARDINSVYYNYETNQLQLQTVGGSTFISNEMKLGLDGSYISSYMPKASGDFDLSGNLNAYDVSLTGINKTLIDKLNSISGQIDVNIPTGIYVKYNSPEPINGMLTVNGDVISNDVNLYQNTISGIDFTSETKELKLSRYNNDPLTTIIDIQSSSPLSGKQSIQIENDEVSLKLADNNSNLLSQSASGLAVNMQFNSGNDAINQPQFTFYGNYCMIVKDKDGNVISRIGTNPNASNFNTTDGVTNGTVTHTYSLLVSDTDYKVATDLSNAARIISAGTFELQPASTIHFANNTSTKFYVSACIGINNVVSALTFGPIIGNGTYSDSQYNTGLKLVVSDFIEEIEIPGGFKGIVTLSGAYSDLANVIKNQDLRFIVKHDNGNESTKIYDTVSSVFVLSDFTIKPIIDNVTFALDISNTQYYSGINYIKSGTIKVTGNNIKNMANPIRKCANNINISGNLFDSTNFTNTAITTSTGSLTSRFDIKTLKSGQYTNVFVAMKAYNGINVSDTKTASELSTLYINNTFTIDQTNMKETFKNQSYRKYYNNGTISDFNSEASISETTDLMVSYDGLIYPPSTRCGQNFNTSEIRKYYRLFTNENTMNLFTVTINGSNIQASVTGSTKDDVKLQINIYKNDNNTDTYSWYGDITKYDKISNDFITSNSTLSNSQMYIECSKNISNKFLIEIIMKPGCTAKITNIEVSGK